MLVLVGLGNPETKYSMNRHNVGFMTIDSISKKYAFSPFKSKFQAHITKKQLSDKTVLLVKPQTFMNLSGQSLNQIKKLIYPNGIFPMKYNNKKISDYGSRWF